MISGFKEEKIVFSILTSKTDAVIKPQGGRGNPRAPGPPWVGVAPGG